MTKRAALQALALLTLLVFFAKALSFTNPVSINNNENATTLDTLSCTWTASPDATSANVTWYKDGQVFKNETGAASPSTINPSNTSRGQTWNCTVTITNGTTSLTSSDDVTIVNANPYPLTVYDENNTDIGNATTIYEDTPATFTVNTSDPDGDQVSYSSINLPAGASFNTVTGVFQWTPNASDVGSHVVTFIGLDNQTPEKGSTAKDITFTVQEVNDNPVFNPSLTDQTATEGVSFTYDVAATDEESDYPLSFSLQTDLTDLVINQTSNTTATITFVLGHPVFEDKGNHTVNVTVNDTRNGSTTSSFVLEVIPVNQKPKLYVPNASGTQGQPFYVLINATDKDVNDTLTFGVNSNCTLTNPWSITKLDQVTQGNITFSNASIDLTLTNNHVACKSVNISVTDGKETTYVALTFNLTNVNDPPVIHENSTDPSNSDGSNITLQTAYANAQYKYVVNATDPDSLVEGGEVLTFSDNTSLFEINQTTGVIIFNALESDIGNYSVLITVTDDQGLNDSKVMLLTVKNNSAPVINPLGNVSCAEDIRCVIFITASDADGDNVTFQSNSSVFEINAYNNTAAVLNKTFNQSFVGNYSVTINATDSRGATSSINFTFTINNTNDAPVIYPPVTFPTVIVATHSVNVQVTSDDEDRLLFGGAERLTYNNTFILGKQLFNITTEFNPLTNKSIGVIQFTPGLGDVGNYSVNITVIDPHNATDSQIVNFTVLNKTNPPNITKIKPYGLPVSNATVFSFANTSLFPGRNTSVTILENTNVTFNHTTVDDTTAYENLTFTWKIGNATVATTHAYTKFFNYFSAGEFNLTLTVEDDRLENSTWTWYVTVQNVNRPPVLHSNLENVTIDSTETFVNYLYLRDELRFLDDDDDPNGNSRIDDNETNRLSFTVTSCDVANITITGVTVRFTPLQIGTCEVVFNATDPEGASAASNPVFINVTAVPNGTQSTVIVTVPSGGGGGGGGGAASIVIPRNVEVETPEPLNIIAPGEVTIYRNRSIVIPVFLENNWNKSLKNVDITAFTNATGVKLGFDKTHFSELKPREKQRLELVVSGYRLGENFEILLNATVEDPEFTDTALILVNSIEQTDKGEEVEVKVTFARDLLSKNKECQELNELLGRAEAASSKRDYSEALKMLDTIINGCKYLMSKTELSVEEPKQVKLDFISRLRKVKMVYAGAAALLLALITSIVVIEVKMRRAEKEEA